MAELKATVRVLKASPLYEEVEVETLDGFMGEGSKVTLSAKRWLWGLEFPRRGDVWKLTWSETVFAFLPASAELLR